MDLWFKALEARSVPILLAELVVKGMGQVTKGGVDISRELSGRGEVNQNEKDETHEEEERQQRPY